MPVLPFERAPVLTLRGSGSRFRPAGADFYRLMEMARSKDMARSNPQLPRMQNQARTRAPLEIAAARPASLPAEAPKRPAKPQMMRQYELVDRVRRYNPHTDEALLNRAYVYAMKAHGEQ